MIWLALAALQCQHGGLEAQVKAEAMRIIGSGADLERWRSTGQPALVRSRRAVLARLRAKLEAPPRPARVKPPVNRKKRPLSKKSEWPREEVFAYRLRSGRSILLHVIDHLGSPRAGWAPMVAILDWRHLRLPSAERIQSLPYVICEDCVGDRAVLVFSLGGNRGKEMPADRVTRHVATRFAKPWRHLVGILGGCRCTRWRDLDKDLEQWTGWNRAPL